MQVKEYAEVLEKQIGYRPICFITNGLKHYILDGVNRRQIAGSTLKRLQLLMDRRHLQNHSRIFLAKLGTTFLDVIIRNMRLQVSVKHSPIIRRQALLVMATGSGKPVQRFP